MMQIDSGGDKLARGIRLARAVRESGRSFIVYDDSRVSQITPEYFTAAHWPHAQASTPELGGRAPVLFVVHAEQQWVVRHYRRGGMLSGFLDDRFLWTGADRARPVREWDLLAEMHQRGLPVPLPIAAHAARAGVWYRADLITERLPAVESLAHRFSTATLARDDWAAVGATIARFHTQGYCHADMNAYNIQLDPAGQVYVLDWDRGSRRRRNTWQHHNLQRLERSLHKIARPGNVALQSDDWQALLQSYRAAADTAAA